MAFPLIMKPDEFIPVEKNLGEFSRNIFYPYFDHPTPDTGLHQFSSIKASVVSCFQMFLNPL